MEISAIQNCDNRTAQINAGCIVTSEVVEDKVVAVVKVLYNGNVYTEEEFNIMYPVNEVTKVFHKSKILKGENSDQRGNWMNGKKSY